MARKLKSSRKPVMPLVLIGLGGLLLLIVAILLIRQGSTGQTPAPTLAFVEEPSYPEVARISLEDAKIAFDNQEAVFLDVRGKSNFDQQHIQGAINIPLNELETRIGELDPDAWIITYCT